MEANDVMIYVSIAGMLFEGEGGGGGWGGVGRGREEEEEEEEWVKGSVLNQTFSPARAKQANPDPYLESSRVIGEGRGQTKTQFSIREKWTLLVPQFTPL